MKKFTKVSLIVCGILAALGIIFCIIGFSMGFGFRQFWNLAENGAFSWGNWTEWEAFSTHKETLTDNMDNWSVVSDSWETGSVKNLDVEFDFGTIELVSSTSGEFEVNVDYRNEWRNYTRSINWELENDGTLKIRDDGSNKIMRLFRYGNQDAILTIGIPKDQYFEKVKLEIGAALVSVETGISCDKADISVGAGELECAEDASGGTILMAQEVKLEAGAGHMFWVGIETDILKAECGVGQMELSRVTAGDTKIDCGIGYVSMGMTGQETDYDYDIECGIGQVTVGSRSYTGLGHSKQINNDGAKKMKVDCGIGEIEVYFQD